MNEPSVLIPVAPGTNRDGELALAFEAAGARASVVPLQDLRLGQVKLRDHQLLALPGGFSYGDALGAGRLLGLDLESWFVEQLNEARASGMPMIGICNGFQALVRAGLLPGEVGAGQPFAPPNAVDTADIPAGGDGGDPGDSPGEAESTEADADEADDVVDGGGMAPAATLAANKSGRFECRWVNLAVGPAQSPWLAELDRPLRCPVAHGEGRFRSSDPEAIEESGQIAFRYATMTGVQAGGGYPANPNGSEGDIAGIVDPTGAILGLMPHPEDHVFSRQDPARRRQLGGRCLPLFEAGVRFAGG